MRAEIESLLSDGETVSDFVEASVRATVLRRRNQAEFIARAAFAGGSAQHRRPLPTLMRLSRACSASWTPPALTSRRSGVELSGQPWSGRAQDEPERRSMSLERAAEAPMATPNWEQAIQPFVPAW